MDRQRFDLADVDEVRDQSEPGDERQGRRLAARAATSCVTFDFGIDRPRRLTAEERELLAGFADTAG